MDCLTITFCKSQSAIPKNIKIETNVEIIDFAGGGLILIVRYLYLEYNYISPFIKLK